MQRAKILRVPRVKDSGPTHCFRVGEIVTVELRQVIPINDGPGTPCRDMVELGCRGADGTYQNLWEKDVELLD